VLTATSMSWRVLTIGGTKPINLAADAFIWATGSVGAYFFISTQTVVYYSQEYNGISNGCTSKWTGHAIKST